ncbi:MAG TPA: hypothetical protein VNL71_23190 [Chloroflexota bacterium]|nr:hypothetical protein [Chloroflexota bacterium]
MELLHEGYPVLIGLLLSPIFIVIRALGSRVLQVGLSLAPAVAIGAGASALNGELVVGFPAGLFAVAADSMLVYGAALVASHLFWTRLLSKGALGAAPGRREG